MGQRCPHRQWVHGLAGECGAVDTGGEILVRTCPAYGALSYHGQVFRAPHRCERAALAWRSVRPGRDDRGSRPRELWDTTHCAYDWTWPGNRYDFAGPAPSCRGDQVLGSAHSYSTTPSS